MAVTALAPTEPGVSAGPFALARPAVVHPLLAELVPDPEIIGVDGKELVPIDEMVGKLKAAL